MSILYLNHSFTARFFVCREWFWEWNRTAIRNIQSSQGKTVGGEKRTRSVIRKIHYVINPQMTQHLFTVYTFSTFDISIFIKCHMLSGGIKAVDWELRPL